MNPHRRRDERGQILVLFALGLVALIAMVGLVIDGSGAFAQRRVEQNGADLAALAGANAYMNTNGSVVPRTNAALAAARAAATQNGYTSGTGGATVNVSVSLLSSGAKVTVGVTSPHDNSFARILGQNVWPVSVSAAAVAGSVDTATGAAPWLMHITDFNADGTPKYGSNNPQDFGEVNGDYPVDSLDIAWTDFNGGNNVNTNEVAGIIDGSNVVTATIALDQYIGQHNQGNHTALYSDVQQYLAGKDVPIPVTGPCPPPNQANQGCFKGWAIFHVIGASGGTSKTIRGYFTGKFTGSPLSVGECTPQEQQAGTCGLIQSGPLNNYVVQLTE